MQVFQGYRKQLSSSQAKIYDDLKVGITKHLKEINVSQCADETLKDIFEAVLMDNPEIFCTKGYRFIKKQDSSQMTIMPVYTYSEKETRDILGRCREEAERLIQEAYNMDERDKELFIHDLLLKVTYGDGHKPESHSIIGPLVKNVGVCEGISKTAKYLFDMLGMKSMVVYGVAKTPKGQKDEAHAWNCVNLSGDWYHLDITFDNSLSSRKVKRYDYLNLSDYEINADHQASKRFWAKCPVQQNNYYCRSGAAVETKQQLYDLIKNSRAENQQEIIVKFLYSKTETAYQMLREVLSDLKIKESAVGCNTHQMVFHIIFKENN